MTHNNHSFLLLCAFTIRIQQREPSVHTELTHTTKDRKHIHLLSIGSTQYVAVVFCVICCPLVSVKVGRQQRPVLNNIRPVCVSYFFKAHYSSPDTTKPHQTELNLELITLTLTIMRRRKNNFVINRFRSTTNYIIQYAHLKNPNYLITSKNIITIHNSHIFVWLSLFSLVVCLRESSCTFVLGTVCWEQLETRVKFLVCLIIIGQ